MGLAGKKASGFSTIPQSSTRIKRRAPTVFGPGHLLLRRGGLRFHVVGQPGQAFEETFAGSRAAGHDVPDLVLELGKLERLGDFLGFHG